MLASCGPEQWRHPQELSVSRWVIGDPISAPPAGGEIGSALGEGTGVKVDADLDLDSYLDSESAARAATDVIGGFRHK